MPLPSLRTADALSVSHVQRLKHPLQTVVGSRHSNQVNVIGHKAIGEYFNPPNFSQYSLSHDRYGTRLGTLTAPSVCTSNFATSIAQMTGAFPTPATTPSYSKLMLRNNIAFTFDAGGTATGGKLTLWTFPATCVPNQTCTQPAPSKIGSANYEIRTVNGQQILVTLGTGNAANNRGEEIAFAVYNGKLHGGSYTPVGVFAGSEPGLNRTAFDAVLGKAGLPAAK